MNVYANFDLLYLMANITAKYSELSFYEINVLLYLSKLISIYDGQTSTNWKYDFTVSKSGAPISKEILTEIETMQDNFSLVSDDDIYFRIANQPLVASISAKLSLQKMFVQRTKYLQCTVDALLSKTLPTIVNAMQREPGIKEFRILDRSGILHDISDSSDDDIFTDFKTLKSIIGDIKSDVFVPACIWIDCLSSVET
ncbi:hypothetical protein [Allofournierella sp.]|uniref:hypothetical protein n=1 Tax=Allofournierella sp. TaxID=1940256 RepID=UPI003AEF1B37